MATTEQFSLRWNNFHSNLTSGFHELLEAAEMVDVTLAVDGHFLQAHKIVLSICSPFFKKMFQVNPCKHPIVILKDVGHENMKDILEFMYMGEVSVLRENLTQFLRTAELLQVKGLTGDDSNEDVGSAKDLKRKNDRNDDEDMYHHPMIETDVDLPVYTRSPPTQLAPTPLVTKRKSISNGTNLKRAKPETPLYHQQLMPIVKQELEPIKLKAEFGNSNNEQLLHNGDIQYPYHNVVSNNKLDNQDQEPLNMKTVWDNNASSTSGDVNSSEQGKPQQQQPSNSTNSSTSNNNNNKHLYQCGQCMKKFSRKDHLRTHEKNIHGEFAGPFKCVICEQLYKNTESLRKHISKFHFSTINETIQRVEVNA